MRITLDTIVKDNDPILRTKSEDVALPLSLEDRQLLNDMITYVRDSTDPELAELYNLRPAVGIAAIQVGVPKKMLAIVIHEEEETIEHLLVNQELFQILHNTHI